MCVYLIILQVFWLIVTFFWLFIDEKPLGARCTYKKSIFFDSGSDGDDDDIDGDKLRLHFKYTIQSGLVENTTMEKIIVYGKYCFRLAEYNDKILLRSNGKICTKS